MKKPAASADCFFVFGTDEGSASAYARELVGRLVPPDRQAFGLELIDGDRPDQALASLNRCIEALQTVGFLGGEKVVWLRSAGFLGPEPGKSDEVKARIGDLSALIRKGLAPGQKLVISAGKVDGRSAFLNVCKEHAEISEFKLAEKSYEVQNEAARMIGDALEKTGIKMTGEAMDAFIARTGNDVRQIANEVEKLALFLGGRGAAGPDDVRAIVSQSREAVVWDFADAVFRNELPAALRILGRLLVQKEQPIGLLVGLERRVNQLIVLRTALDRKWARIDQQGRRADVSWNLTPEAEQMLGALGREDPRAQHPYRLSLLARQAGQFPIARLLKARDLVIKARLQMVSTGVSQQTILELLVMRLIGGGPVSRSGR